MGTTRKLDICTYTIKLTVASGSLPDIDAVADELSNWLDDPDNPLEVTRLRLDVEAEEPTETEEHQ